jgi:polyphosphate kinase 2 (PPK2 family)
MSVLDRSWYGRVLVERVEGFATEAEWRRAYDVIRGFEESLVNDGMVLQKFWLHISDAEQLARFEGRKTSPLKEWTLTEEDWRNRAKRSEYETAVEDMLSETDRPGAPWAVVPANSKRFARVFVLELVVTRMEQALTSMGRPTPPPL